MTSKSALLKRSHLCVILDREILKKRDIGRAAIEAIEGGADMIQLRDKRSSVSRIVATAKALRKITARRGVALIINDRVEAALGSHADGLHVGRGDISPALARRLIGANKILGVSAAGYKEAVKAKRDGADYIGVGPVFKTPIKDEKRAIGLGLLKKARRLGLPVFAIGGIDGENILKLRRAGFKRAAVIRACCGARDISAATSRLKKALI